MRGGDPHHTAPRLQARRAMTSGGAGARRDTSCRIWMQQVRTYQAQAHARL